MTGNRRITGRSSSIQAGLLAGAAASVATTAFITALLAVLLDTEKITWDGIGYGVLIMIMLSAFLGAVTAYAKIQRQRLVVSLMSGGVYFGILLMITALFFGGKYEAVGETAFLVTGGCMCAVMIGTGGKSGKRKRYGS